MPKNKLFHWGFLTSPAFLSRLEIRNTFLNWPQRPLTRYLCLTFFTVLTIEPQRPFCQIFFDFRAHFHDVLVEPRRPFTFSEVHIDSWDVSSICERLSVHLHALRISRIDSFRHSGIHSVPQRLSLQHSQESQRSSTHLILQPDTNWRRHSRWVCGFMKLRSCTNKSVILDVKCAFWCLT